MNRYEFALLRYVNDPVGGEFANIGVRLYDLDGRRMLTRVSERYGRITGQMVALPPTFTAADSLRRGGSVRPERPLAEPAVRRPPGRRVCLDTRCGVAIR